MATRFYFSKVANSTGLTPAYDAGWEYQSEAGRFMLSEVKTTSDTLASGTQIGPWTANTTDQALDRQYISDPIGQDMTLGGAGNTVTGWVVAREFGTTDNITVLVYKIFVLAPDGSVRGTLKALSETTVTELPNSTAVSRQFANAATLTAVNALKGDRIVIELGYRAGTSPTTPEAQAIWGQSGTDASTANATGVCPWVQFSQNIPFLTELTLVDDLQTVDRAGVPQLSGSSAFAVTGTGGSVKLAQEYSPSQDVTLAKVGIIGRKIGSPTDNIRITITQGASPGGTQVAQWDFTAADFSTDILPPYRYSSALTPFTLMAGMTYFIEVIRTGASDASNYVQVGINLIKTLSTPLWVDIGGGLTPSDPEFANSDLIFFLACGLCEHPYYDLQDAGGGATPLTLDLSDSNASNWSDALGLGHNLVVADTNILSDALLIGHGSTVGDNANNLADAISLVNGIQLSRSDQMRMADAWPLTDDFNRANNTLGGTNWNTVATFLSAQIFNNALAVNGTAQHITNQNRMYGQYASARILDPTQGKWAVGLRSQSSNEKAYWAGQDAASGLLKVWLFDNGNVQRDIATHASLTLSAGDVVRFHITGDWDYAVYVNDVLQLSGTIAATGTLRDYTEGRPGFIITGNSATTPVMDDWSSGGNPPDKLAIGLAPSDTNTLSDALSVVRGLLKSVADNANPEEPLYEKEPDDFGYVEIYGPAIEGSGFQQYEQTGFWYDPQAYFHLTSLELYTRKVGTPADSLVVDVYANFRRTEQEQFVGTLLASVQPDTITDNGYTKFVFSQPLLLRDDTIYAFVVRRTGVRNTSNYWQLYAAFAGFTNHGRVLAEHYNNTDSHYWTVDVGQIPVFRLNHYRLDDAVFAQPTKMELSILDDDWYWDTDTWQPTFRDEITVSLADAPDLGLPLADSLSLSDAVQLSVAGALSVSDSFELTDDALQFIGWYGFNVINQSLSFSDEIAVALLGNSQMPLDLSDALTLADSVSIGLGLGLADLLTLADAAAQQFGYQQSVSDNLNNWLDSTSLVYGYLEGVSDTLNLTDALAIGYGLLPADVLSLADALALGSGLSTSDVLSLTDSHAARMSHLLDVSDVLSLTDAFAFDLTEEILRLTQAVSDQLVFSDALQMLNVGWLQLSDTISWSDNISFGAEGGTFLTLSDVLVLVDAYAARSGGLSSITDALVLSDTSQLTLGGYVAVSDTISQADGVILGTGSRIADSFTIADTIQLSLGISLQASDVIIVADSLGAGHGLHARETLSMSDSISARMHFLLEVADVDNSWSDELIQFADQPFVERTFADVLAFTDDIELMLAFRIGASDTMSASEAFVHRLSFELNVSELMPGFTDVLAALLQYRLAVGEDLDLWQDFVDKLQAYRLALTDSYELLDEARAALGLLLETADQLPAWSDEFEIASLKALEQALLDGNIEWLDEILVKIYGGIGPVGIKACTVEMRVHLNKFSQQPRVGISRFGTQPGLGFVSIEKLNTTARVGVHQFNVESRVDISTYKL